MGAVWDHSTGRGRNRVRLGGEKEGGVIVGEGERDGGEEGAGRVRLGGKEAKGSGDGDRGSESTLDSLEEPGLGPGLALWSHLINHICY